MGEVSRLAGRWGLWNFLPLPSSLPYQTPIWRENETTDFQFITDHDLNLTICLRECASEYAEVIDCVFNENLDDAYVPRCEGYCAALQLAACDNTEPVDDCESTCVILGSAFPVCSDVYTDFLECGAGADVSCNAEGEPAVEDCASDYVLFLGCLVNEYDWQL